MNGALMRPKTPSGWERGVTLVELLVVVVLIGIIAFIGATQLGAFLQKQKLAAAAADVRSFLQEVPQQVAKLQAPVFARYVAGNPARLQISRDAAGTQLIRTYTLPLEIQVETCDWPTVGSDKVIRCDTMNRATDPTTNAQVSGPQTFRLTHKNMVSGFLRPKRSYEIQVAPVWGVTMVVKPY